MPSLRCVLRDLASDCLGAGLCVGAELVGLLGREAPAVLFLPAQVGDERAQLLELRAGLVCGLVWSSSAIVGSTPS